MNAGFTRHVIGLPPDRSDALLSRLFEAFTDPAITFSRSWSPGDVAVWDEHRTVHRGPNDFAPHARRLHRCTAGSRRPMACTAEPGCRGGPPGASVYHRLILILLRHGRTPNNAQARLQGQIDSPLDEVGFEQSAVVGKALRDRWPVDRVVTSSRRRTRQTSRAAGLS